MYIPEYLEAIQADITAIQEAAENAAKTIEGSKEYRERLHPFHAAAVATYNRLVSVLLDIGGYKA